MAEDAATREDGNDLFMVSMAQVFVAGLCSCACVVTALHGHYLAALLGGFLASILWRCAYDDGMAAARIFSQKREDS